MGQITSLFVRKVVGEVDESADKGALLRSVGIHPDDPVDASRMVSDTEYYAFFERCAAADENGTTLPLRVLRRHGPLRPDHPAHTRAAT